MNSQAMMERLAFLAQPKKLFVAKEETVKIVEEVPKLDPAFIKSRINELATSKIPKPITTVKSCELSSLPKEYPKKSKTATRDKSLPNQQNLTKNLNSKLNIPVEPTRKDFSPRFCPHPVPRVLAKIHPRNLSH